MQLVIYISKFAIELNLAILKLDVEKLFKYFKIYFDKFINYFTN